jgi:thiamine biosynthesis lipoprotein
MGTTFAVVLYAPNEAAANRAFQAVFDRIAELNRVCSDYDPDSEVSRLSARAPTTAPAPVSEDLFAVLHQARALSEQSQGAFDVTVGPLTRLWRRARLQKKPPAPQRLEEARQAVGYQHLVLHESARSVELLRPGMRIDLGGIAKGYTLHACLRVLREQGISSALVNAGGNIAVSDAPPSEQAWKIDIAPLEKGGQPTRHVWLRHGEVATSGDLHQFLEIDGVRYSHILDPRTGWGLTRRSQVTVITRAGTQADGLSTAVSVLGPPAGLQLIESIPGAAALIMVLEDERPVSYESSRLKEFTLPQGR